MGSHPNARDWESVRLIITFDTLRINIHCRHKSKGFEYCSFSCKLLSSSRNKI